MAGATSQDQEHGGGNLYLVRSDEDGNEIWSNTYEAGEDGYGTSVIEADNGDFVVGCRSNSQFHALRIREDGELVWRRSYDRFRCNAVIELKNGNFMLAGDAGWCGRIVYIDGQGDVIWNRTYQQARLSKFYGLRETDGGVVASGSGSPQIINPIYAWAIKVEIENGDPIWSHLFSENGSSRYYGTTSSGDGGFVICGHWTDQSYTALVKFDSRGEEVWEVHGSDWGYQGLATGISRAPDDGYAISANIFCNDDDGNMRPSAARFSSNGDLIWQEIYELDEDDRFAPGRNNIFSVIVNRDNELIAVGTVNTVHDDDINYDGLLMKLERDTLGPRLIRKSPESTHLSTLVNDVVHFKAVAYSPYRGELDYLWTLNDSTDGIEVRHDTLATIAFDRLGVDTVRCDISDDDASISVIWHVTVTDLYISSFSPDTLNLSLRRGETVDFSLDTVRAVEGIEDVEYLWLKSRVDGMDEVDSAGTESRATVSFLQSGNYAVEGLAYRGESFDAVSWNVSVRGVVWSFAPEELALEVLPDSLVRFEVFPSNPEDSSLSVRWFVDDEFAAEDTTILDWGFFYPVHSVHNIYCVLSDSIESDTVSWTVTVRDLSVKDKRDAYPTRLAALLSVSPNPFNSTLTIRYSSPINREATSISIHDISGREVSDLSGSTAVSGGLLGNPATEGGATKRGTAERTLTWDASNIPAGVYFVRLQSGAEVATKKVVLMR